MRPFTVMPLLILITEPFYLCSLSFDTCFLLCSPLSNLDIKDFDVTLVMKVLIIEWILLKKLPSPLFANQQ